MKKISLLIIFAAGVVLSLQNCKRDPPVSKNDPNDPDSLYIGTSYDSFLNYLSPPFPFFHFPKSIPNANTYYTDSMTIEGVELGRRLFYDPRLSSTGALSCASCHKQEFAFSDAGNVKSTNVFGLTERNSPAIQNLLWSWSGPIFWDGRVNSLHAQAKDAFDKEQGLDIPNALSYLRSDSTYTYLFRKAFGRPGDITEHKINLAIQQFMFTLVSYNSDFDKWQRRQITVSADVDSGFAVFRDMNRGDCIHCHTLGNTLLMTNNSFNNNGLDNALSVNNYADKGRGQFSTPDSNGYFKTPSLRNVALTAPYMHDGRFTTLEQVIDFYSDEVHKPVNFDLSMHLNPDSLTGRRHLTADEKRYLVEFLKSLTDYEFINNSAFKDPF